MTAALLLASGARGSDYARELLALATGMSTSRLSSPILVTSLPVMEPLPGAIYVREDHRAYVISG